MALKAILFDVDGVLLDSTAANAAFYRELFRQAGADATVDTITNNHMSMADMLHQVFPDRTHDQIRTLVTLGDTIDTGYDLLRLGVGVDRIIPDLAGQYKLALVTNRTREGIEELWKFSGLQKYFSAAAAYEDTVKHKPDPEPIHYVLSKLGVEPREAIFVGDAKTDLQAGQAAKVPVIILGPEAWPGAMATLSSLSEITDALQNWTDRVLNGHPHRPTNKTGV